MATESSTTPAEPESAAEAPEASAVERLPEREEWGGSVAKMRL